MEFQDLRKNPENDNFEGEEKEGEDEEGAKGRGEEEREMMAEGNLSLVMEKDRGDGEKEQTEVGERQWAANKKNKKNKKKALEKNQTGSRGLKK